MMFICFLTGCDMLWYVVIVMKCLWFVGETFTNISKTQPGLLWTRPWKRYSPHIPWCNLITNVSESAGLLDPEDGGIQWNANVWLQQNHPKDDHGKCWFLWNSVDVPVRTYPSHGSGVRIKAIWSWCRHAIDFQWNGPKESCRFPRSLVKHAQVQSGWSFWVVETVMFGWDERN